jgi:hypothetical protein
LGGGGGGEGGGAGGGHGGASKHWSCRLMTLLGYAALHSHWTRLRPSSRYHWSHELGVVRLAHVSVPGRRVRARKSQ